MEYDYYEYRCKHPKCKNGKSNYIKYVKTNDSEPFGIYLFNERFSFTFKNSFKTSGFNSDMWRAWKSVFLSLQQDKDEKTEKKKMIPLDPSETWSCKENCHPNIWRDRVIQWDTGEICLVETEATNW